jgi:hypothetical protein
MYLYSCARAKIYLAGLVELGLGGKQFCLESELELAGLPPRAFPLAVARGARQRTPFRTPVFERREDDRRP